MEEMDAVGLPKDVDVDDIDALTKDYRPKYAGDDLNFFERLVDYADHFKPSEALKNIFNSARDFYSEHLVNESNREDYAPSIQRQHDNLARNMRILVRRHGPQIYSQVYDYVAKQLGRDASTADTIASKFLQEAMRSPEYRKTVYIMLNKDPNVRRGLSGYIAQIVDRDFVNNQKPTMELARKEK